MVFTLHGPHFKHRITQVYLAQALTAISHSLIGIFIPIYLLTLEYTLAQVFVYFMVHKATVVLVSPVAAYANHQIGFKKATLLHIPFFVLSFALLYALSFSDVHYLLPAIMGGVSIAFYWIPMKTLFIKYSHKKSRGQEVGTLQAIQSMLAVASPAIGGVIAALLGFPILIIIGLFLGALAAAPLFFTPEIKAKTSFAVKDLWRIKDHGFMIVTLADGFLFVAIAYLFPILIYMTLQTTTAVGYIESIGMILFALGSFIYGKKLRDPVHALRVGAVLIAISLVIRPFLDTATGFSLVIMFGALAGVLYRTGYNTLFVDYGRDLGDTGEEYVVVQEIYLNSGRVIALGLCILFPWTWGFFFAAAALVISLALFTAPSRGTQ